MRIVSVGNWWASERTNTVAITIEFDTIEEASKVVDYFEFIRALEEKKKNEIRKDIS